jgi:hypothetical protein
MDYFAATTINGIGMWPSADVSGWRLSGRLAALVFSFLLTAIAIHGQVGSEPGVDDVQIVDGTTDTMAFSLGRTLKITGTVRGQSGGAIALGGDVIVHGVVEGDVAAVGGSVIQMEGSRIGGDVFVVGGSYRQEKTALRDPARATVMVAGYEQELRNMLRDPSGLLTPRWSPAYLGIRVLAVLFWFVVSLALTAAMPGTISRGIARLQLTSLRVAVIGIMGAVIIALGVPVSLRYLPTALSVVVLLLALLLILVAWLLGRVMLHAATGRWLQRRYLPIGRNSESVALLIGTTFWVVLSSLPYVWPFVVAAILVTSLGLGLTARYNVGWKRRQEARL